MPDSTKKPSEPGKSWASKLSVWAHRAEDGFLVVLFLSMLGVAAYQVIARELLNTGTLWGADFVGVAVLWVTMSGAAVASRSGRHIKIDAVTRFLSPRITGIVSRIINLATAAVCLLLAWYAIDFIKEEYEFQTVGIGSIPAWVLQLVIPIGAAIMAARYIIHTIWPLEPER